MSNKAIKKIEKKLEKKEKSFKNDKKFDNETKLFVEAEPKKEKKDKKVVSKPKSKVCVKKDTSKEKEYNKFDEALANAISECHNLKTLIKNIKNDLKILQTAHKLELKANVKKAVKNKKTNHKASGFASCKVVTGKLAEFIGVEPGTELSGPKITSKVWDEFKNRNLVYEQDKRILRVDKTISELFNVPMSVNDSTEHNDPAGLNFGNIQKFIKNLLKNAT
jgi:hypothetical protein